MLSRLKKLPKYIFIFLLLFAVKIASAQKKYDAICFRVDSLAAVGLPKSALKEVDKLDKLAHDDKNTAQQIRAVIYRITFQSYIEENALVAIINRLKKDIAQTQYPAKPVMQSMLAEMYWNYYKDHRYEYSQRSRLLTPGDDYTQWDLQTIISETGRQYKLSLAYAKQEQETPITLLDGVLTGDKTTRYLRPTLYDLLAQRALDFYLDDEPEIVKPKMPFSLKDPGFFSDGLTFTKLPVSTTDTASTWYQGIKLLQQVTVFHLQTPDEQALANLNLQRLKFLHEKSNLTDADSLYIAGLKQIANKFSAQPISVQALSLLGFYYKQLDSLVTARGFFEAAKTAFPNTMGGKNAANYIGEIDRKELSATVEDVSAPDKPILAQLTYRNVKHVKFSVYGVTDDKIKEFKNKNKQDDDNDLTLNETVYGFLKKLKPVETAELTLPDNHDYRNHKTEFKIAPLHPGNYIIVVEEPSAGKSAPIGLAQFKISGLSYATRQRPDGVREVWVMDRDNGRPLKGVKVKVYNTYNDKGKIIKNPISEGLSNAVGVFTFSCRGDYYNVNLSTGNDSFTDRANYVSGPLEKPLKEPLLTSHTILFTDRRIYRPGQTVYFKGLQIKTYNNKSVIVPGESIQVTLLDANRQKQGELNLATNEYGSITGSFIIPQHIINGVMFVTAANGSVPIRVEEYKRPTFQLAFTPIKETYRFNDSVHVKGKVTAFSGYGLSGVNVAYVIKRTPGYNALYVDSRKYDVYDYSDAEISSDTIKTDINGEFKLAFKAMPDEGKVFDLYEYTITADVTDGSGETQSASTSVNVGNSVLDLALDVPGELFVKDKAVIPVKLNNQNGQRQSGVLEVKLYALKQPDAVFKNRLWDVPDQYILSRDQYKKLFPGYAYANEDDQKTWKPVKTIIDANINVTDTTNTYLDLSPLRQQLTGVYKLVVNARNVKGDTTSKTSYINFYRDPGKAATVDDWVTAVTDKVDRAGDTARFWIGVNRESHVLVEKYLGPKLLSSVWVTVGSDSQQELKVPVPASGKNNFAVQLLMVNDNRLYSYYKQVAVNDTVAALKVRLLTFRDKLQPGQKEQWKLQVSGQDDGKVQAEMLAGMYDASLDAITPAQNWNQQLPADNYNPHYFEWRIYDAFVNRVNTDSFNELPYYDIDIPDFYYERINWFGYAYLGGDNSGYGSYLESVKENIKHRASDRKIEAAYTTNALKVKNGYVVSGRVLTNWLNPEAGVKISIKGSGISTYSNSLGYYKIKIPYKATLIFAKKYCDTRYVTSPSNGNVFITSNVVRFPPPVVVADMEVKEQKDDPNAEVRIDEPVGNSDMKGAVEADVAAFKTPRVVGAKAKGKSFGYFANYTADDNDILRKKQKAPVAMMYDEMRSPVIPRKNFNETAFFYPQLRTDEKGQVLIEFTIPEALTKWKFRAFAHNKQLQFGYTEAEVVTQKQLSITANMPRFLREGDTVTVSARLANLETAQLKGTVELKLFNAVNMQPVGLFVNHANAKQAFEIDGSSTKSVSFKLIIPAGLDALTYRLTADAGKFTDGEENTIPVLPNRMPVTESMPMMVRAGQSKTFSFDKLINQNSTTLQNKTLTLEYTQNPAWYAVQAIPYMMEFPYECSEQLFSRYYANSLSTDLIAKMPVIKQVFDRWKNSDSKELLSNLEKNQELKATLLEETPWLQDAISQSEHKKRIAQLFDLNKMSYEMKANLDKLKQKQLPNGAFPWFGGDYADDYITRHVLEGIGQLYHLKITTADNKTLKDIADKALGYMDTELLKADKEAKKQKKYESRDVNAGEVHAWYIRSYFTDKPLGTELKAAFNNYLKRAENQWVTQGIYQQGMIALTMARNGKLPVAKAIVKSLMETSQQSDEMGMYWGKNLSGYYWYQSPIETQSLMIELFTELGGNAKAVEEMKIWLMRNKQTNSWQTTKATAAAVYALLLKPESWLQNPTPAEIKINGSSLASLKPDVKTDAGTCYIKTNWVDEQVKPGMGRVEVKNSGQSISYGAMYWQYLEQMDKITSAKTDLSLERKYFIKQQTDAGPVLQEVDASHQPKTGDLLKVVVYLKAGRDYEYVQLKDLRPAGTEPISVLSEYKYQDGLSYYQVTKDVATNFFISHLNKGNYVFEYELRVAQPGSFSTGVASIQCMYAPEFNAHSEGRRVVFKP